MRKIKTLILSIILLLSMVYPTMVANATTCFYQYEQISGMNKICYYDCLGSGMAITISSVKLCPLTISR